MRSIEISEAIQNIYKSGESLNQTNMKITERARQLEDTMITLLKDVHLKEICAHVGSLTYNIDTSKSEIRVSSKQLSTGTKILSVCPFNEALTEYATREEEIQFIKDAPEIFNNIHSEIASLNAENEKILDITENDFWDALNLFMYPLPFEVK